MSNALFGVEIPVMNSWTEYLSQIPTFPCSSSIAYVLRTRALQLRQWIKTYEVLHISSHNTQNISFDPSGFETGAPVIHLPYHFTRYTSIHLSHINKMVFSWIPLFYSALRSQVYEPSEDVTAGSWCELLSQPEVIEPSLGIHLGSNEQQVCSDHDMEGWYAIDAALANLHNEYYAIARFVVPSKSPLYDTSAYSAHWDSSAELFYVEGVAPEVYQIDFPEITPISTVTPDLETLTSSHVEEAVTQASENDQHDGSSSLIGIDSGPALMSSSWADMVEEDLEEMNQAVQNLSTHDSSDDYLRDTSPIAETVDLPSFMGQEWAMPSITDALDLAKNNETPHSASDEWETGSRLLVKAMSLELYSVSHDAWNRYTLGMPLEDSEQSDPDPRKTCLDYLLGAAFHTLNNAVEPERIHHFNFSNTPMWRKSTTPPAVSLWATISEGLKGKRYFPDSNLRYVLASQAGKYIDPFCFTGPAEAFEELKQLRGTALRDAATTYTQKAYHHAGNWVHDQYDPEDDVPMYLHEVFFFCCASTNVNQPVPPSSMSAVDWADKDYIVRKDKHTPKPKKREFVRGRKTNLRHVQNVSHADDERDCPEEPVEKRAQTTFTAQTVEPLQDGYPMQHSFSQYEDLTDIPEARLSFPEFFFGNFAISVGRKALGFLSRWR